MKSICLNERLGLSTKILYFAEKRWKILLLKRMLSVSLFTLLILPIVVNTFLLIAINKMIPFVFVLICFFMVFFIFCLTCILQIFWFHNVLRKTKIELEGELAQINMTWPDNISFPKGDIWKLIANLVATMALLLFIGFSLGGVISPLFFFGFAFFKGIFDNLEFRLPWSSSRADKLLNLDPRKPVLFFRSFQDEYLRLSKSKASIEEKLVNNLSGIGPTIAVGRPGELLPRYGAARFYVPDVDWQTTVVKLINMSRIAVFYVGESPGVIWEESTVFSRLNPCNILLYFGEQSNSISKERRYQMFINRHEDWFVNKLPATLGDCQYLSFTSDWSPILLDNTTLQSFKEMHKKRVLEELISNSKLRNYIWEEARGSVDLKAIIRVLVDIMPIFLYPKASFFLYRYFQIFIPIMWVAFFFAYFYSDYFTGFILFGLIQNLTGSKIIAWAIIIAFISVWAKSIAIKPIRRCRSKENLARELLSTL